MNRNDLIEACIDIASMAVPVEEGDYIKDGLLHCGKCNTPKQTRQEFMGRIIMPRCLCKCGEEKRDREERAFQEEQRRIKIAGLRKMGFPDSEMAGWTFDRDDHANEKISTVARRYVDNFDEMKKRGKGLLLYGSVDTGKTFISACIANALIDQGYACLVTNFARLTNTMQNKFSDRQEYIDDLNRFSLIVIDDLASERDTEYMNEVVTNIIDARYRVGKPLIVTTNLTSEELKNPKDIKKQRIYSRLLEMCFPVEVEGVHRRKEKLKQDFAEMRDMLGL